MRGRVGHCGRRRLPAVRGRAQGARLRGRVRAGAGLGGRHLRAYARPPCGRGRRVVVGRG